MSGVYSAEGSNVGKHFRLHTRITHPTLKFPSKCKASYDDSLILGVGVGCSILVSGGGGLYLCKLLPSTLSPCLPSKWPAACLLQPWRLPSPRRSGSGMSRLEGLGLII